MPESATSLTGDQHVGALLALLPGDERLTAIVGRALGFSPDDDLGGPSDDVSYLLRALSALSARADAQDGALQRVRALCGPADGLFIGVERTWLPGVVTVSQIQGALEEQGPANERTVGRWELDGLRRQLQRVRDLHAGDPDAPDRGCTQCGQRDCATRRILDGLDATELLAEPGRREQHETGT